MTSVSIRRLIGLWGLLAAIGLVLLMVALAEPFQADSFGPGHDARAYWSAPLDQPYIPGSVGQESAYLYSPAFIWLLSPLRALSWPLFLGIWTTGLLAVLFWLARPLLFLPLLLLALPEIWGGNITILLAAAIVLGFGRAWTWAFPLLTKVVPGVGILWFAVRREWFNLSLVIAATLVVIAGVALFTPGLWADWFQLLLSSTGSSTVPGSVPVPLALRLPFAIGLVMLAAWRDMRWLLPIGVLLAMPVVWWGSLALLTASVALRRDDIEDRFDELLLVLFGRYQRLVAARAAATTTG